MAPPEAVKNPHLFQQINANDFNKAQEARKESGVRNVVGGLEKPDVNVRAVDRNHNGVLDPKDTFYNNGKKMDGRSASNFLNRLCVESQKPGDKTPFQLATGKINSQYE
jgi:hypothetical protein